MVTKSRFIIEVGSDKYEEVEKLFDGIPHYLIGKTGGDFFIISNGNCDIIKLPIDKLYNTWKEAVEW